MTVLAGRHVVLGVAGGIASYKTCTLARLLTEAGATVDVVLTRAAGEFVRPVTFEALTGRPVFTSLWEPGRALDHITLARDPDLVIVAPATAHLLARAAQGMADDVLTTLLVARDGPVLAAPAMNDQMYAHERTSTHCRMLSERGWTFVGPDVGALAEGPADRPGRMSEPETIAAEAARLLLSRAPWAGRRILVTAGPTREWMDPVRFVSNPSSGRMGFAIAAAAWERGANTEIVAGPSSTPVPYGPSVERVSTTQEMLDAVAARLPTADVLFMVAAPADYRPRERGDRKRARVDGGLTLALDPTPDILESTRDARKAGAVIVGFALETGGGRTRALEKLERKDLDFIVLNDALESGAAFESDTNRVWIFGRDGFERDVPLGPKAEVANVILDTVESAL